MTPANYDVEIVRDQWGIPHVFAGSLADASFALGFVHAQDRLWQMELMRRAGEGRLSEVVGPATLAYDRLFRTVGLGRIADTLARNARARVLEKFEKRTWVQRNLDFYEQVRAGKLRASAKAAGLTIEALREKLRGAGLTLPEDPAQWPTSATSRIADALKTSA